MKEKFLWVVEHWTEVGMVMSLIALIVTGKWALLKAKVAAVLAQCGEGEINRAFRKKVASVTADEPTIVKEAIANLAAKTDPDPNKKPESKGKRVLKFLGRSLLAGLLKR